MGPGQWSTGKATNEINACARSDRLNLSWRLHAKDQMADRDIVLGDVLHVLRLGFVLEEPRAATRGFYRYLVEASTPNSEGRKVGVVVIPDSACQINCNCYVERRIMRLDYRYDECGLDNIILVGLETCIDDEGETVITIQHINVLHRAIVEAIAKKPTGITGRELRFIRTELGLTQAELASRISKDVQTVGRWERGEFPLDPTADTVIRVLALQHVEAAELPRVEEMSRWAVASSGEPPIRIDATDPEHWRQLAA